MIEKNEKIFIASIHTSHAFRFHCLSYNRKRQRHRPAVAIISLLVRFYCDSFIKVLSLQFAKDFEKYTSILGLDD